MVIDALMISLFCWGLWNFIDEWILFVAEKRIRSNDKRALYHLAAWLTTHADKRWAKPLWTCPMCMPSIWGSIISLLIFVNSFADTAVIIAASSGINYLVVHNLKTP
jgi:hypothetical protein